MPENYIAMFAAPREDEARKIIERAEEIIDQAAEAVRAGQPFPEKTVTLTDRVLSGAVNPIFYPMFVHADKFYVTDACISCGEMCEGLSAWKHTAGERKACMGEELYPLYGLYLPLSQGGGGIREAQQRAAAVCLSGGEDGRGRGLSGGTGASERRK